MHSAYKWAIRNPGAYLWKLAKSRARRLSIEFAIRIDDVVVPTRCPVLGIPIRVKSTIHDESATLDRIDNSKGYLPGNVAVISMRANSIKGNATIAELRKVIRYMKDRGQS